MKGSRSNVKKYWERHKQQGSTLKVHGMHHPITHARNEFYKNALTRNSMKKFIKAHLGNIWKDRAFSNKALKEGYYWPMINHDGRTNMKKCEE